MASEITRSKQSRTTLKPIHKRFSVDEVHAIIDKCHGVRTQICAMIDCSQQQLKNWLDKHEQGRQWLAEARQTILDLAESVIIKSLNSEDPKIAFEAAKFTLNSLGRHRGYGLSTNAMQVNVVSDKEDIKVQINNIFGINDNDNEQKQ